METNEIGEEIKLAEILQRPQNKSNQDSRREEQLKALSEILSELDDFQNIVNQNPAGAVAQGAASHANISYINSESIGSYQPQSNIIQGTMPNNLPGGQQPYPGTQQSTYPNGAQSGYAIPAVQQTPYEAPAYTQPTYQTPQSAWPIQQPAPAPQVIAAEQKVTFSEEDYKAIAEKVVERIKEEIPESINENTHKELLSVYYHIQSTLADESKKQNDNISEQLRQYTHEVDNILSGLNSDIEQGVAARANDAVRRLKKEVMTNRWLVVASLLLGIVAAGTGIFSILTTFGSIGSVASGFIAGILL